MLEFAESVKLRRNISFCALLSRALPCDIVSHCRRPYVPRVSCYFLHQAAAIKYYAEKIDRWFHDGYMYVRKKTTGNDPRNDCPRQMQFSRLSLSLSLSELAPGKLESRDLVARFDSATTTSGDRSSFRLQNRCN